MLPVSPIELEMLSSSTPDIALKAITDVPENIEMAIVTPLAIEDEITFDPEIFGEWRYSKQYKKFKPDYDIVFATKAPLATSF